MAKEMKLTPKQRAFCDYYIETKGNATQAAIMAGYSEKTAKVIGSENLSKPYIAQYIEERMKPEEDRRIASAEDVAEYLSRVMFGEEKDQFGLDASLSDRTDAAKTLARIHSMLTDKVKVDISPVVISGEDKIED